MDPGQTNHILGYPPDTRLLILNADDFGMCQAVNAAIIEALSFGLLRSTTVMVPCPWAPQALNFLAENPQVAFGVHLTAISDPAGYRWGPVSARERVPSLVDAHGFFYDFAGMPILRARAKLAELETEFRAQIETVLAVGLRPTHLDWHALRFAERTDIYDLIIELAREYGLAVRLIGQAAIDRLQAEGLPTADYDFLDSYLIDSQDKISDYTQLLRELPSGLSEWAVHPGLDTPELRAIDSAGSPSRQADFDFFTSPQARAAIEAEGIILIDYRGLQAIWRGL